jgi:DnaJ-class molecular chaperone
MSDNHHSSLLRTFGAPDTRCSSPEEEFDPYWNIEVCTQCGGSGQEPSGVEYMGISEMLGCEACYGIGYTNERIREVLEQLDHMI